MDQDHSQDFKEYKMIYLPAKSGTSAEPSIKIATPRVSWSSSKPWTLFVIKMWIIRVNGKLYFWQNRTLYSPSFQAIPCSLIWGLAVAAQAITLPKAKAPRVAGWRFGWNGIVFLNSDLVISWCWVKEVCFSVLNSDLVMLQTSKCGKELRYKAARHLV